ncbi:MAG: hypothetical protein E7242_04410 [Lachnospiraceae bacterium]|nr:hypothetical protein [Lachnospiraceae bacterium]
METLKKHLLYNIIGTILLALLGAIYELFSHGVYSYFMIYAFAIPLVMGVLFYAVLLFKGKSPGKVFLYFWNTSIAAFGIGCAFAGVLEIYGTSNSLIIVYPIAGAVLMILGLLFLIIATARKNVDKKICIKKGGASTYEVPPDR